RLAAAGAQVPLVVDEQGRAELLGQLDQVAAADREPVAVADRRRVGQQPARERSGHRYIRSGAWTPRRPRPTARPTLAASTSHSRTAASGTRWISRSRAVRPMPAIRACAICT